MPRPLLFPLLPVLFSLTLFLSAGLLFLVEPMIGKMILPLLGGTPAVWNTCMMFFQAVLLIGYGYAHLLSTRAQVKRQIAIHTLIFIAACIFLPIAIPRHWLPSSEGSPAGYILLLLSISVGLPFFVLSANALLLQRWFADTGHPSAKDPYFLYSASNLGSMLALISYPALIEPYFRLAVQSRLWTIGYVLLFIFTLFCAWLTGRYLTKCHAEEKVEKKNDTETCAPDDRGIKSATRAWWVLLAFVPSSLMLGVTTFLSTDVAAIPLFWVIPLSLYLLSFIIVFARVPDMVHRVMIILLPLSITALIFVKFSDIDIPKWVIFLFHLVNFFIYAMVCHGEVARSRPEAVHLTEFYLWISVGGVLGGIFNSLVAPVVFSTIFEYPLILALGALLLPVRTEKTLWEMLTWKCVLLYIAIPIAFAALTCWSTAKMPVGDIDFGPLSGFLQIDRKTLNLIITYGFLGLICYGLSFLKKPFLFGIGIAILLMTLVASKDIPRDIVHRERSFFGVLTVERNTDDGLMSLTHGTTLHGMQWLDPYKRFEPLSYYHAKGPVGRVFSEFSGDNKKTRIAVAGLGAGTIAAYAGPGQEIDFYEIDPAVKRIATNPNYFTYLNDCRANWRIILGDARLTIEKASLNHYGIIILDAFSSDSIPVHLLTKEAINLYFSKLGTDGVLLFHISNQYLNLAPVLAATAREGGYVCRIMNDNEEAGEEKDTSEWALLARKEKDFGDLSRSIDWKEAEPEQKIKVWTDDFCNILSVFRW